ncbi:MAG: hypothetical protein KGO96_13690 [Elusimicrobia bacterium]|nr:hypothetical protein [Elusimicrobiota bacterium]MDE2236259.1 hypothetical protein [Elusimicrobiota bacterium]MDE2426947.1 hypothetical protein [Elusimicrobiota bacterium]
MLTARNTADLWTTFLTLTYPLEAAPRDGKTAKRHLHAFLAWLRRETERHGRKCAYLWVLEFQENGAPHFHFLIRGWVPRDLWRNPDGKLVRVQKRASGASLVRRGLETAWYEIVGSGLEKARHAGTQVDGVKNTDEVGTYIAKYVGKLEQKEVPGNFASVGRFWGASRCLEKTVVRATANYERIAAEVLGPLACDYMDERQRWSKRLAEKAEATQNPAKRAKLEAQSMSYAVPWEWKGYGYTFIGGASLMRSLLRAAVRLDAGDLQWTEVALDSPVEKSTDGRPRDLPGQLRLNGTLVHGAREVVDRFDYSTGRYIGSGQCPSSVCAEAKRGGGVGVDGGGLGIGSSPDAEIEQLEEKSGWLD